MTRWSEVTRSDKSPAELAASNVVIAGTRVGAITARALRAEVRRARATEAEAATRRQMEALAKRVAAALRRQGFRSATARASLSKSQWRIGVELAPTDVEAWLDDLGA